MRYRIVLRSGEYRTHKSDGSGVIHIAFEDGQAIGGEAEGKHFWWVLKSEGNGAVLATSETYTTRRRAFDAADALAKALDIEVEEP